VEQYIELDVKMRNWKLLFVVLLINLATFGDNCIVKLDNKTQTQTFNHCKIDDLKFYVSIKYEEITELDANGSYGDDNDFPKLDDGIFKNYTNLETLDLVYCKISEISAGAFQGLTKLKSLRLGTNNIKNLHKNVFKPLINLETLYLYNNLIENLDKNWVKHNPKLTHLRLYSNKISWLDPEFFSQLKNLEELWLGRNMFTTLSRDTFEENKKLKILHLDTNAITAIEQDTLKHFKELKKLNLKWNKCINRDFDYSGQKINMTELDTNLTTCYKGYENLAREVRKLIETKTPKTICPTNKVYVMIFGSIWFLLFMISLLVNVFLYIRTSKKRSGDGMIAKVRKYFSQKGKSKNEISVKVQEESLEIIQPEKIED
jgi:hypothetical protein